MKKKILIISTIILIIIMSLIGLFVFYKVQQKGKTLEVSKINDTEITEEKIVEETKEENISNNELIQNTEENIEQETEEKQENKETKENNEKNIQATKEKTNVETQKIKENNNKTEKNTDKQQSTKQDTNSKTEIIKKEENKIEIPKTEEVKPETSKVETKKIDLSKYDRYENASDGGYKAYKKSDSEISKLKGLIESCIKEFGYTNVKLVQSSSIINTAHYFTANKTNVSNKVYNSEDFTIYYYAETEYHITSSGEESVFQNRSYIEIN